MVLLMIITGFEFDERTGWMAALNAAMFSVAAFGLVWHVVIAEVLTEGLFFKRTGCTRVQEFQRTGASSAGMSIPAA